MIDATKLVEQAPIMSRMASVASVDPAEEPISLERAKTHLRLEGVLDDDDAYIQALIVAARQMAEGRINRTITQRELVASFDGWGCKMPLLKPPFVELLGVDYLDADGNLQSLPSDSYYTFQDGVTQLGFAGGAPMPVLYARRSVITVRYLAGYPVGEVPEQIIMWMLLQIGSMYAHRESVIAGVSVAPLPEMYEKMFLQPYMVYE